MKGSGENSIPLYDIRFSIRDPNERIEFISLEPRSMAIVPVNEMAALDSPYHSCKDTRS